MVRELPAVEGTCKPDPMLRDVFLTRGIRAHQRETPSTILAVGREQTLRVIWVEAEEVSTYVRYIRPPNRML